MTNNKAIKGLKMIGKILKEKIGCDSIEAFSIYEVIETAINALEQEPCEDCISRKEALKLFEDRFIELQKVHQKDKQYGINWCINTLKDLPSVNPQKIGHWIKSNIGGAKVCSVCKAHMGLTNFKFCPNCGAKMVEPQEREE